LNYEEVFCFRDTSDSGNWKYNVARGHDPEGKILGIVGMGDIGQVMVSLNISDILAMAIRAITLGMEIQYYNRNRLSAAQEKAAGNATYVSFDELLATSDVISLNLPLNPKTHHIISHTEFAKMKDGVVIINTARGAVIDEAALVDALNSGKVASAGLDVYEDEPNIHPGLIRNENVLLIPHLGTHTYETQKAMEVLVINNIRAAITKGKLLTPVN
jgi:glyoxylate reductase